MNKATLPRSITTIFKMKIGIINYGTGNIHSISNALNEIGADQIIINSPTELHQVDAILLPGVGGFADSKTKLDSDHWTEEIIELVKYKNKAILGICLGMQLLSDSSTESSTNLEISGLGLIPGKVKHLSTLGCNLRTPHVGWNSINIIKKSILLEGLNNNTDFYFVHSYAFSPIDYNHIIATSEYGVSIPAVVRKDRVWGTQFHPEKSSKAGFILLKNFIKFISC